MTYFKSRPFKFRFLTIAIILWFVLFPFLEGRDFGLVILNVLTSSIVLFGIYAVSQTKRTVSIGLALGLPWFVISWIDILISPLPQIVILFSSLLLILFLAFTAITILLFILRSKEISGDILYGAVCIYFLIGGTWSSIYMLLEKIEPGSIINNVSGIINLSDLLYFSYITLTTLGYGEIIPVTAAARSLAIIEAIVGVMYIAIIISRLVGLFIAKSLKN
jgi:voltage-gated potassium channel Kch